jgi:hypothetical protein
MKPAHKIGAVAAGYFAAFLLASAAVAIRLVFTGGPDAQAASGMYAFGDLALFVAVFGLAGLVPTGAAMFFLSPYRYFWVAISSVGFLLAVIGVAAAVLFAFGRGSPTTSTLGMMAGFSVSVILASPIIAPIFLIAGLLSPHKAPRLAFLTAALLEVATFAYAVYIWFGKPGTVP